MSGRPFLQIPGPTNVPDRILRAMDRPVIDHRSPEFGQMVKALLPDVAKVFKSEQAPFWHQGDRVRLYEGKLQPV